jgi:hypothetical protein
MNKLRSVLISTFLIVVCGAGLQNQLGAKSKTAPLPDMDPHMSMTKSRSLQPGDQARGDAILAAAKKAADGYTIFLPEQRQNVYHFILAFPSSDHKEHFDADQPRGLLYTKIDGPTPGYKLIGVMYMARYDTTEDDLNARVPLSIAQWHLHLNLCVPPQPEQRNWLMGDATFGLNGSIATAEACRAAGGYFKPHLAGWMTHIYPFETDPARIWGAAMGDDHGMEHNSM